MHIELICLISFFAGLVDAIAGGGGLILIPSLMVLFPQLGVAALLGTNKFASSAGTLATTVQYIRKIKVEFRLLVPTILVTSASAMLGTHVVMQLHPHHLKAVIILLLLIVGGYSLFKPTLGLECQQKIFGNKLLLYCMASGSILGFYDGFFGPGTGSLLMFIFVSLIGWSFLKASVMAKVINFTANISAFILFALHQKVVYTIGVPLLISNVAGNLVGSNLAIKLGSKFIKRLFLIVVAVILMKLIFDSYFS